MEYKRISTHLNNPEVTALFSYIFPEYDFVYFISCPDENAVVVGYTENLELPVKHIAFFPDDIKLSGGQLLEEGDLLYKYRQYTTAKGFSDIWKANPFVVS